MKPLAAPRQVVLAVGLTLALAALLFTQVVPSSTRKPAISPATVEPEPATVASARDGAAGLPAGRVVMHRQADEAPLWALAYGKEFWRRPAKEDGRSSTALPAPVNLGDVIERVSHAFTREMDLPRVDAKTFSVTLDGEGLRFAPHRTALEPGAQTEAHFGTLSVRSGGKTFFQSNGAAVPWSVVGNTAQGLLNGDAELIEHYEVRDEGVEVTWVVQQRLAGNESLEIEVGIAGLNYVGDSEHGHHFADANGIARLRVGAVTLVDACGARTEVPSEVTGDRLLVRMSADTLAGATFPIAIDPLLSPEFGMDEPVSSFSLEASEDPAIASNGSEYLVVWADLRLPGQSSVFGTRLSSTGAVLDPRGRVIASYSGGVLYPAVASNGRDYLVAWRGGYTGGVVLGTRVTSAGVPLDTNFFLQIGYSSAHPRPSIASDGTNYLVVWEHPLDSPNGDEDILGARVSNDGQVLDVPSLTIRAAPGRQRGPAVACNGALFLVAWNDDMEVPHGGQTFAARVTGSGAVLDPNGFMTGGRAPGTFPTPAVASNGRDFLVVDDGAATRVSRDGTLVGNTSLGGEGGIPAVAANGRDYLVVQLQAGTAIRAVLVGGNGVLAANNLASGGDYFDWSRPAVASAAGDFFSVWDERKLTQRRIVGAHVTGAGSAAMRGIPISTEFNSQLGPAVASNGRDYLVVWNDHRFGTLEDIYGVRIGENGTVLDLSALPIRRGAGLERDPSVASDGRDYFVVWQEYRGGNHWRIEGGRVTSDGAVLDPAGVNIRLDGLAPAVASNGRDYLVAWAEYSGNRDTFNDIRGARVGPDAVVLDPASFLISDRPNHEYAPAAASDGTDYLVAWHGWGTEARPLDEVFAARITSAGTVADPDGFPLTTSTNFYTFPAVAFNGADYLVVWPEVVGYANTDIRGTRVSTAGAVLDSPALAINSAAGTQFFPAVASDGRDFLVAWSDERSGHAEVFGARVTGGGNVIEPDGFLIADANSIYGTGTAIGYNGGRYLAAYTVQERGLYRTHGRFIEFTLPPPWLDVDVGRVGIAGGAGFSDGAFTVNASGTNIWGRADAFHFVHQTLAGDGEIIARVVSLGSTHPRAKAGVMFRDGLSSDAKNVFLGVTSDRHVVLQARANTGGRTFQVERSGSAPLWVRLVRRGRTFIGYRSTNGVNWRFVWFAWMNLPASAQAGLAVTAHNDDELNTAVFDNVRVIPRTPPAGIAAEAASPLAPEVSVSAPSAAGAGFKLHISGIEGRYVIEASNDLSHWTTLGTATSTDGAVEFTDNDVANHTRRFYRVRLE